MLIVSHGFRAVLREFFTHDAFFSPLPPLVHLSNRALRLRHASKEMYLMHE